MFKNWYMEVGSTRPGRQFLKIKIERKLSIELLNCTNLKTQKQASKFTKNREAKHLHNKTDPG